MFTTPDKKYTLEDWAEQQAKDFKKYGPVPDEIKYSQTVNLKIGVITPTHECFRWWLNEHTKPGSDNNYVKISRMEDVRAVFFSDVVDGYRSNEVKKEVRYYAHSRLIKTN